MQGGAIAVERLCSFIGRAGIVAGSAVCHLVGRDLAIEGRRRRKERKATSVPERDLTDSVILRHRSICAMPKN
ncbi:protein of unknown function [Magnetospirillum sp. XM-1]|nr:protein of unknown function [Magnetospirillum sp. XM-1]